MAKLISSYNLKNKIFSFYKYIESINKSTDLEKCIYKITNDIKEIIKLLEEIYITVNITPNIEIKNHLESYIDIINVLESVSDIKEYILQDKDYVNQCISNYYDLNDYSLISYYSNYLSYYFDNTECPWDIDDINLSKIALCLDFKRKINLFYPQCSNGNNFNILKQILDPIDLYGIDEDVFFVNNAKEYTNNIIKGKLKGSKISNKCFDVLFLTPRITLCKSNDNSDVYSSKKQENNEKYLLKNTLKYLREDGIFIFTIPFFRLTLDMCIYIAKNLKDITIFRHDSRSNVTNIYSEILTHKITLIGYKSSVTNFQDTFEYLRGLKYEDIDEDINKKYEIKDKKLLEVELFRGSVLDKKDLKNILKNDGLYNDFISNLYNINIKDNNKPLIPFTLGQIALILTSGQLDGVINEVGDINHVIKGMTIRNEFEETKENSKGKFTTTTTTCNIVQINVIDAGGNFKTLV